MIKKNVILLSLIILTTVFSGCGSVVENPGNDKTTEEKPAIDLEGYNFRYYQTKSLGYTEDTLFADLAMQRVADTEQKLNCKIEFIEGDFGAELKNALAAGTVLCDAGTGESYSFQSYIRAGMFYPISGIEAIIDFKNKPEKWGNKFQLTSLVWNKELYGVLPMFYPEFFYNACDFAFFVNEDTIKSLGQPDPREFVENGQWNRAKLEELMALYTHTNTGGEPVKGLGLFVNHFFDMSLRTRGVEYTVKENDVWVSGLHTQKAVDALSWAQNLLFVKGADWILPNNTYPAINAFVDGKSTMILTHVGFGLSTVDTKDFKSISFNMKNFGILPFPLSDDMPANQWIGQHEYMKNVVMIPANAENPETSAYIIDALYEPLPGYETDQQRFDYYMRYIFHDTRDADVIFKMLENNRYTYYIDGARDIVDAISTAKNRKTVTEILESQKNKYQKVLDDVIIPSYESIEFIWGNK
jgi:uncharacterized protein YceK